MKKKLSKENLESELSRLDLRTEMIDTDIQI